MSKSPFESDIEGQADALRAFGESTLAPGVFDLVHEPYERIVLTGMGSSHSAGLRTWRHLTAAGHATWWVDTGQLLDTPQLVTPHTLLVATSQSGASAEITALFDKDSDIRPASVIGITNDRDSPLAKRSQVLLELHSGEEATVSTKSYLNSLAAHQQLLAAFDPSLDGAAALDTAKTLEHFVPGPEVASLARHIASATNPRVAFVGSRDHAATALYAGLITKEASKIPAEGFIGGQFRHGPFELAGPGLTAVLFGVFADDPNPSLRHLAADLVGAGSRVMILGDLTVPGAVTVTMSRGVILTELAVGALVAQHLAVDIAKARAIEPGAFAFGAKVTTTR